MNISQEYNKEIAKLNQRLDYSIIGMTELISIEAEKEGVD